MIWFVKNKKLWRVLILIILVIAMFGPWFYERIVMPAQYECQSPSVRLEGDFCGSPVAGIHLLYYWAGVTWEVKSVLSNARPLNEWLREFLMISSLNLVWLPGLLTLRLVYKNSRGLQLLNLVLWGCALISIPLFYPDRDWISNPALWGIWLYLTVAIAAIGLEMVLLQTGKGNINAKNRLRGGIGSPGGNV